MEVQGTVVYVGETQTVGASNFRKREFVIKTEESYPQEILMEFVQDKVSLLDNIQINQQVKAHLNLRGRSYVNKDGETKWMNQLQAWKIDSTNNF